MSVQRSPTKKNPEVKGGSLTDLSKMQLENINTAQRKRKQPENDCDCQVEIQELRHEISHITKLLETLIDKQDVTLENMKQNLTEIKDQICDIKQATTSLTAEQNDIRSELSKLNTQQNVSETKMQHIESNFEQITNKLTVAEGKLQSLDALLQKNPTTKLDSTNEEFFWEIQERNNRMKNLIIFGVPEYSQADIKLRHQHDQQEVAKILDSLIDNCPKPFKIIRIGKYNKDKNRHIKICFTESETPRLLLSNKTKLKNTFKIFTDQTPMQQKLFRETKMELNRRLSAGETNLIIKYVKGIPKVIENRSQKN